MSGRIFGVGPIGLTAGVPRIAQPCNVTRDTTQKLSQQPKAPATAAASVVSVAAPPVGLDPAANYTAAWKQVLATANQVGRTQAFRVMQDSAEQAAPHDGLGIVGFAGVAAGAIFMRDALPIEKVLLLYEPFASAFPYESLA